MSASRGEGFHREDVHGLGFQAIQEYFQQRSCRFCAEAYAPEGVELLREEPGVLVVRVVCMNCTKPLGIALVGMSTSNAEAGHAHNANHCAHVRPRPTDEDQIVAQLGSKYWTKRDSKKLSGQPPITYDDVLAAHQFLDGLGDDWQKHLPKLPQRSKSKRSSK